LGLRSASAITVAIAIPTAIPVPAAATLTLLAGGSLIAGYLVDVFVLFEKIRNVQEPVTLQTHIHEGRLHSRKHAGDAALVNASGERILIGPLEENFHQLIVINYRYACLVPIG